MPILPQQPLKHYNTSPPPSCSGLPASESIAVGTTAATIDAIAVTAMYYSSTEHALKQ